MDHELHAFMAEGSPNALVALDDAGCVQGWNRAAGVLFGYSVDEALHRRLDDLITPPGEEPLAVPLADAAAGNGVQFERLCRHQDGSLIHVLCTLGAARTDPATGAPRLHCAMTDVTPMRVQRDRQLVATRYQGLLELAPDAIVIVNDIGRIVLFNARARDLFGHADEDVMGAPVEVLMPERLRAAHRGHRSAYSAEPRMRGMGAGLELAGLRRDGTEFPVEISLSPIHSDIGQLVMSAIRDISERKHIERRLIEQNGELERASRARDNFLATMSHELRTPLNAILGFTGLLLMKLPGPLNEAQQRQLELVHSSGKHLLSLINDLLDLAKVDAGKVDLQPEPVACSLLLEEVADNLRPAAAAKGLELVLELPQQPVRALADRRALRQIALNLTSNAVKFTAQGRVLLRAAATADGVRIDVQDTGVGIADADQVRLFEAFQQFGGPRPAGSEGTGLGLHLSRRLATLMNARIECVSRLGQGSCFSLHLPAVPAG